MRVHAKFITVLLGALLFSLSAGSGFAEVNRTVTNNGNLIMEDIPPIPEAIKDDLNRFQNVRSAPFRDWTRDGKGIYVSTRFADVSQLHVVGQAGGTRRQLTFFDEPVSSASRQPRGDLISFTMDAGGSENSQVFLLDPETGKARMISDGDSRNGAATWRRDGKAVVYSSTRRNGASNDLWLTEIEAPAKSRMILESPDGSWWGPGDWSADGSQMLIQQYISVTDSRIHSLNLKSGELTLLKGSKDSPSVNYTVAFDKRGDGYYFLTDLNNEFAQLAYQSFDHDEHVVITHNIPWDVDNVAISEDRERIAFTVNAGGTSDLYLMSAVTKKFAKPEDSKRLVFKPDANGNRSVYRVSAANAEFAKVSGLPLGTVSSLGFSPDASQLALTLNTAKTPSDSFVLHVDRNALKHGALTRWTFSEVGGLNTEKFIEPELIHYPTFDQVQGEARKIPAFVYRPAADPRSGKRKNPVPVIISIHGGPESQYRPRFSSTFQLWLNKIGAAVIAPNVRGSAGYGGEYVGLDNGLRREDSVRDIGALLDWIATQPDLDKDRVVVVGGSYGGYMVLACAVYYSDRLRAAVDIVGISNFVTFLKNTKEYRRDLRRAEYGDERDPAMLAHLQKISPNNSVDKIKIPMLVVQGQNDPRVPVTEAEQIVKALRSQGSEVWYMNALNEGHGYRKKENRDIYQQAVVMFIRKHLGTAVTVTD